MGTLKVLAAARSLNARWLAINPFVHDVIRAKLRRGHYNHDLTPLIKDLMGDGALFGYCLRKLFQLARETGRTASAGFDLPRLFREAGHDNLRAWLDVEASAISHHRTDDIGASHLACLHHHVVSTQTTEILCEKAGFSTGIGYAATFLRQLGLALIAWNYPHIFRQALSQAQRGTDLDEALFKNLGYSPRALALAVARDWGCSDEMLFVLGEKNALAVGEDDASQKLKRAADLLVKSCEVGELLAQASHPEMYPSARKAWGDLKRTIETALGGNGLALIQERIGMSCKVYLGAHAEQLSRLQSFPLGAGAAEDPTQSSAEFSRLAHEPAAADAFTPLAMKEKLRELYRTIAPRAPQKESMMLYAYELVPSAGFSGGCVLMFDFESAHLIPRFRFGTCMISSQKIPCSALSQVAHPVAEAFRSDRYIFECSTSFDKGRTGYIAQAFGVIQRVGVLYLQIGSGMESVSDEHVVKRFQLLRKALMDTVNVK